MNTAEKITVEATVNAPIEKVWDYFNNPEHITKWGFASDEWHCPKAESDFKVGGKFSSRMEAKDGSMGFDFWGTYDTIEPHKYIAYTMGDGRKVNISFAPKDGGVHVSETFEAEQTNPVEMQKGGWQAIMDNFKKVTESN